MTSIFDVMFYVLIFLSVYVQVFFFVTFLENRKKIVTRNEKIKLNFYPAVTIVVPCWNEENTIEKTVQSLFNLNYPKDKIKIFLINDGSTDNTRNVINKFAEYPNIKIFHKENGGKYTALNLGLENSETDFFGCLDADSFADSESLIRIMSYFEKDEKIMAVVPSVVLDNSVNFVQSAQRAEYYMGVYFKKMLSFLGAIDVTPGPLTIFRKKVFNDLGHYRQGHNTEDMEIAYRMQKNQYKIGHCNDAFVFTNTPKTIKKLYRQRLRWIFGFINNVIDYRSVLFKKKYGNFSIFVLPTRVAFVLATIYLFGNIFYNLGNFLYSKIIVFQMVGFHPSIKNFVFDPFFINLQSFTFLVIVAYVLVLFSMILGRRMVEGKWSFSVDMLYFFPVFALVAPFWLMKAIYNTILQRKPSWR
jgi:cellulose synthase/poly-beta-1,6-N-acetylglucosamine synthase-like glycosyltransferase